MQTAVPQAFIKRRLHSLMGLWLVIYLMEHLLVNSQAALWVGDYGKGFVDLVNLIHGIPYLQLIETLFIGVPLLLHGVWGIKYALQARYNVAKTDGSKPSLPYARNKAYTLQRLSSWFLLIAIAFHVVEFRFLDIATKVENGNKTFYLTRLNMDTGLYTLSTKLGVTLYDSKKIEMENALFAKRQAEKALKSAAEQIQEEGFLPKSESYNAHTAFLLQSAQNFEMKASFLEALSKKSLKKDQVIASAESFGTATLLMVRDHFKNPFYLIFYSLFVLATAFHAGNGFWTFLLTWGIILKMSAQKAMFKFSWVLMALLAFLGLAAIWGSYFINLKS